jgi:hypothetical protein
VSESARGPQLYLEADRGRAGRVTVEVRGGAGGRLELITDVASPVVSLVDGDAWDGAFEAPAGAAYVRAQLTSARGDVRAIANPVWAERL